MNNVDFNKTWFLISPCGKLLYSSVDDFNSNKPSYFLNNKGVFEQL
jgi:hypothetical protein